MENNETQKKDFDFDKANLADQITVVGEIEHAYYHALKSAASLEEIDAVYYLTVASMLKDFRRRFMKEHFPKTKETDWCLLKAIETVRQRVYESSNSSYADLKEVNDLWSLITEHIFDVDMSGCVSCREDREEDNREISEEEARKRWPGVMRELDKMKEKGSHEDSLE